MIARTAPARRSRMHAVRRAVQDRARPGFSLIELIVVIGIILLILGIGLPAFNSMSIQARQGKARQILNATLTRAHVLAVADRTLTAVRFVPAVWEQVRAEDESSAADRALQGQQVASIYQWRFSPLNSNFNELDQVQFNERFERRGNTQVAVLPPDFWVAPAEALREDPASANEDWPEILDGEIGTFEIDADRRNDFLTADDFLIVFDPQTGLQPARWPAGSAQNYGERRSAWHLLAYDPRNGKQFETAYDTNNNGNPILKRPYQRFNFTGLVLYDRERFAAVGNDVADRYEHLSRRGLLFYINRNGGNLIEGRRPE